MPKIVKLPPDSWMPTAWPLFWRRAFLLTIPVSGPIMTALFLFIFLPIFALLELKEKLWDKS